MYNEYAMCDCCNNLIKKGNVVYKAPRYRGIYCSIECYNTSNDIQEIILDEDLFKDCQLEKVIIIAED